MPQFELVNDYRNGKRFGFAMAISTAIQALMIVMLIIIPLLTTKTLSATEFADRLFVPPAPPPAKPKTPDMEVFTKERSKLKPTAEQEVPWGEIAPPRDVPNFDPTPAPPPVVSWPDDRSAGGGVFRGTTGAVCAVCNAANDNAPEVPRPSPPSPPPPTPVIPKVVRVGGNVQSSLLVMQVKPVYPELAKRARVQGVVVLEAQISKDGAIENLRVVSGHPLLVQSALDAVKQWRYRPTLLNGDAVPVVTTITVTFALAQ